jgi:hypothetical protein
MCIAASFAAPAQDYSDLLVEMPVVPKNITLLDQRCNYIISRYWDKFNPKSSFSSLDRLDKTFGQFICLTPYATADTVHMAVDHLIDVVQKAKPENLLTLAQLAEKWVYADTAEYLSEELYFSFVEAVVKNKKAKGPSRARFQAQYDQLLNSRQGCKVEQFNYIKPDGTTGSLSDITAQFVLIMFYDPDCLDCSMAKTRLSADYSVQKLIENNQLAVLAIYPDEPTDEWREDAAKMPENWIVGAYPDADRVYTMRRQPEIYFLNSNRVISVKDVPVDNIINAFKQFVN